MSSDGGIMKEAVITKIAKCLVMEQFPQWADLPIVPVSNNGWDNRTFHLGEKMLLRFPSAAGYAPQVEKEQKWLPFLAPKLPLLIPTPLGLGKPGHGYIWNWSIYNWIDGETVSKSQSIDKVRLASQLASFLKVLYQIPTNGGPLPGEHNYYRGGKISTYRNDILKALKILEPNLDGKMFRNIWESGAETEWQRPALWVHGDISPSNLLLQDGDLNAVIDFGLLSVGDPACDLAIAWTFFDSKGRKTFHNHISLDEETWRRGRAWALWKALIISSGLSSSNNIENNLAQRTIKEIAEDFKRNG